MINRDDVDIEKVIPESRKWLGYAMAVVLATGTFISGAYLGHSGNIQGDQTGVFRFFNTVFGDSEQMTASDNSVDLREFWRVWNLLDEKFVLASSTNQISSQARIEGAIQGMVDAFGDPYTVYLPPQQSASFQDDISGNFSGVGMEVGLRDKLITIISPLPGTPAEKAGLYSGDVITKINDVSTESMGIDQAVRLIRGEAGTVVEFVIYREGETEFLTIPVTRATIDIPTVKTETIDDTFIIALYSFNAVSETKMAEALKEYQGSGAKNLVIDVRGNPGGFLQSAVDIASYFLPAGKVVVIEESGITENNQVFRSRNRQIKEFTPKNLVVLVDRGSASASEILAGALKDHGVATIMGTATFGKGSVQELVDLDDGSSLKVTVARWLTPNGVSISDGGLQPDITIERTNEDREAGNDPQKDAVVRFLRGETVAQTTPLQTLILGEAGG
jgi:carboxyl-terminal processing protease